MPALESDTASSKRKRDDPPSSPLSFSEDSNGEDNDATKPSQERYLDDQEDEDGKTASEPALKRQAVDGSNGKPEPVPVDADAIFDTACEAAGPAPSKSTFQSSAGGTKCLIVVCSRVDHQAHGQPDGSTFDVCKVAAIIGKPDPGKSEKYDEANEKMVFTIPDPYEFDEAKKTARRNGDKKFPKISKFEDHSVPIYVPHMISVKNKKMLPGVGYCTVAWAEGLQCTGNVGKGNKVYYDLTAKNIVPVEAIGFDPSMIVDFIKRAWPAESMWYHETPYVSEEDIKNGASRAGDKPLVIPICSLDDPETMKKTYKVGNDRGFFAAMRVRPENSGDFFFPPKSLRDEINELQKTDKSVEMPSGKDARISDCRKFFIKLTMGFTLQQWDVSKSKSMVGAAQNPQLRQHYEFLYTAYSTCGLRSLGVSYPPHWAVIQHHIPLMDGVLLGIEDRLETSKRQENLNRNSIRQRALNESGPDDPEAIGLGLGMRQAPGIFPKGIVFDTREYLRTYALRCDFRAASVLLGARDDDYKNPKQRIPLPQKCSEETVIVYRNNNKTELPVKLNKDPDGFLCVQMTQKFDGNMQKLHREYTKDGMYYVLLPIEIIGNIQAPSDREEGEEKSDAKEQTMGKLTRRPYAVEASKWVAKIDSPEVLRICTEGVTSLKAFNDLKEEWAKADPKKESSKYAAGQWLSYYRLADWPDVPGEGDPPYLVYAIEKPQSPEIEARKKKAVDDCVKTWFDGPSGVYKQKRAGYTLLNPAPSDADKIMEDAF